MSVAGDIIFWIGAFLALASAVATVSVKSPIRAALGLLFHIISLAGLYLTLHAHLLAALQLIVYAGAVVVLFIFVIMLIGPAGTIENFSQKNLLTRTAAGATMGILGAAIAFQLIEVHRPAAAIIDCPPNVAECNQFGGVDAFGTVLFVDAAVPFEIIGVLLLVAILGAIAVARGRNAGEVAERKSKKAALAAGGK